jgi:hypothetical protein
MKRMLMMCSGMLAGLALLAAPAPVARAANMEILKAVPEQAWGVLIIRNLNELDQKLMGVSQQLNVEPISVLNMAKATTGLMSGVNDKGSAALVFMGGPAVMADPSQSLAILVPAQDYAGLTSGLAPEDAGNGISKVMLAGQPSYVMQQGNYAVLGPAPAAVQTVAGAMGGAGIVANWSPHQQQRFAEDDLTLVINLKAILADQMISQMLQGIAAMSGGTMNIEELKETETIAVGIRIGKEGVRIGGYAGMRPGSASAGLMASVAPTAESLLAGLPADNYLVAFGMRGSEKVWAKYAETYSTMLKNPMYAAQTGVEPAKMAAIADRISGIMRDARDVSFSLSALPEGSDGMIGMTKIVSVSGGAAAKCNQVAELIKSLIQLAPAEEAKKALDLFKYTDGAETVAGVKISQLALHLDQAEWVTEDDYRKLQNVLGRDGLLFRLAPIDDQHIVATLGGGTGRLEKIIALAKGGETPLAANAGVKKAAAMLTDKRTAEGYLALDHLLSSLKEIQTMLGEPDAIPFEVPKLDAPIAMTMSPVGEAGFQADLVIPMQAIAAAKDTAVTMQSQGRAQAAAGS